jgi:hypothetical protein
MRWFRARLDTPTMSWGLRKRLKLGPLGLNLSKRSASGSGKFGRFSTNTRTPQARSRPAVRRLVAFPITVAGDKKPTLTRKGVRGILPALGHYRRKNDPTLCI